jgi:molybdopterin molybdotransferase
MQERLSLAQARSAIIASLATTHPLIERLGTDNIAELYGRTLAQALHAPMNLPPFANASMDGYALRAADLIGQDCLPLQGVTLAGAGTVALHSGHCMRITTGAALPQGSDCVVMQEQCVLAEDRASVQFKTAAVTGALVRNAGEDFAKDQLALHAGTRLGAAEVALIHAFGLRTVRVFARPRVLILAGGDELKVPGEPLAHGQIYESNRASLSALLMALGAHVITAPLMPDRADAIAGALTLAARGADLVITTGGASAGDADFLPRLVRELGHIHFYRVRMKPGMPALFGAIDGKPVLALPGNPVSVFVSFLMLAKPAVELLCGRTPSELAPFWLELCEPIEKNHARQEFLRAALVRDTVGVRVRALEGPLEGQGSAMLRGLINADGLIDLPEGECRLSPGTRVKFLPFRGLLD